MSYRADKPSGKRILRGTGREIHSVSEDDFLQAMEKLPQRIASRLAFMSAAHHQVRDFVVRELPRQVRPISPLSIAQTTDLAPAKVKAMLADLEKHLFFLVRDAAGDVAWAFPVTTSRTPHRLTFSTGEKTFGA
jgi:hypothetical protein